MPFSNVSLNSLEQKNDFIRRHIGPGRPEIAAMLDTVGASSIDDLMTQTVPASIRSEGLNVGEAFTEVEALAALKDIASQNQVKLSLIHI